MTEIFVFGSNLAGRHGKGAALVARVRYGAIYGQGEGLQGRSYAIPTKDGRDGKALSPAYQTLPLPIVAQGVARFLLFAYRNPQMQFTVAEIGCGLAGYTPAQIAPMFRHASINCHLPKSFKEALCA